MVSPQHGEKILPPRRLGEFDILRELGRGGMGVVYEAVQTSLGRRVALKVLAGGLGMTPKAVDRFRREAAAAAKLHHSNIVPVYATGEQDGTYFYAMELIDGPSLDRVLKQLREASRERERPEDLKFANPPVARASRLAKSDDRIRRRPRPRGRGRRPQFVVALLRGRLL